MRHLSDGVLRRLCDEPLALEDGERTHLTGCARCHARFQMIAADARAVASLLRAPEAQVDPAAALATLRRRLAAPPAFPAGIGPAVPRNLAFERRHRAMPAALPADPILGDPGAPTSTTGRMIMIVQARYRRTPVQVRGFAVFAALIAALVASFVLTPAGSLAQGLLTIFEPKQFTAIPVSTAELRSLPNLQQYGTMHAPGRLSPRTVESAAAAAAVAGQRVLVPSDAPPGVTGRANYAVIDRTTGGFTFSASRVRAAARASGKPLPPMPAGIDGSTLQVTVGPVVVATYGQAGGRGVPQLVIAQAPLPGVTSTGATVPVIEQYLLAQPGVSPQLAASIRAIGDPTTTLPIPVPIDLAQADHVAVQGVTGLAIGDNTGVGSGVIWEKDGMVYGVAGSLPESQVLAIARALH